MDKGTLSVPGHPHGGLREGTWSPIEAEGPGMPSGSRGLWPTAYGQVTDDATYSTVQLQDRPSRGLTQQLLQHLPVVQVLLQLLHDDPFLHQHAVDPVDEGLRVDRSHSLARWCLEGQAVTRARAGGRHPRGRGREGPRGEASCSPRPHPHQAAGRPVGVTGGRAKGSTGGKLAASQRGTWVCAKTQPKEMMVFTTTWEARGAERKHQ